MIAELRVPLSALPGLDPVGLRVHWADKWFGLVLSSPDADGLANTWGGEEGGVGQISVNHCHLDLSDAATRDRVARWVARKVGLECGSTAPAFRRHPDGWYLETDHGVHLFAVEDFAEKACCGAPVLNWASPPECCGDWVWSVDPADPRLLPDGSRWVDAAALALVAVHVGGTP